MVKIFNSLIRRRKKNSQYLPILFLSIGLLSMTLFLLKNLGQYSKPYDHGFFSRIYSNSPYVLGQAASEGIGDDGLYAFAGYYYMHGGDITQVNFENPPLGKYLIGFSIFLFNNQNSINLLYTVFFISCFYFLSWLIFRSHIWSSFGAMLIMLDPIFKNQLLLSLLDLPLAMFVLFGVFFYVLGIFFHPRFFWPSSFFNGIALATKFFPGVIFFIIIMFLDLYKNDTKKIKNFILSLILIPIIYILAHWNFFSFHHTVTEFIRYQKWILTWRLGNPVVIGNIVSAIFFGQYKSWWGEIQWFRDAEWSPLFAIVAASALFSALFLKKSRIFILLYLLSFVYFLYTVFGTVGYAKYILPVYPFLVILCVNFIRHIITRY